MIEYKIVTEELASLAIDWARPTIEKILESPLCIWGPQWVDVIITIPDHGVRVVDTVGVKAAEWNPEWGDEVDFSEIAQVKIAATIREGLPSSIIVEREPWRLQPGDNLFGGATLRPGGLYAAASGAKSGTDEGIADLLLEILEMLCRLQRRSLQESGVKRL